MAKIQPTHEAAATPTPTSSAITFANNGANLKDMYEKEIVTKRHNCTDILCLILFVVFVLVQVVLSILIYSNAGSPANLLLPHDSSGNLCKDATPELFYFDLLSCLSVSTVVTGCPTPTVCVPGCPGANLYYMIDSHRQTLFSSFCVPSKLRAYYGSNPVPSSVSSGEYLTLVQNKICPMYALSSAPYFHRCLPSVLASLANSTDAILANDTATGQSMSITNGQGSVTPQLVTNALNSIYKLLNLQTIAQYVLQDFASAWVIIAILLLIASVASFIYIVIIRWVLAPMIYLSFLALIGALGFAIYFCIDKYISLKNNNMQLNWDNGFDFNTYLELSATWLVVGIIAAIVLVIVVLLFLVLFKRIRLAIQLISEGSKAVTSVFVSLFFPIIPLLLQVGFLAYFVSVAVYLACSGNSIYRVANATNSSNSTVGDNCDPNTAVAGDVTCVFFRYGYDWTSQAINSVMTFLSGYQWIPQLYNLFMFFWVQCFIVGFNQMVLAGCFGIWYWSKSKSSCIFATSLKDTLVYHLGSVAFGALIIAICKFLRVIIQIVENRLKSATGNHRVTNCLISFSMCCCKCCFWCLEKVLKFINRNAYIMVAIYGRNFCKSAVDAVTLLAANPLRALVLDRVTDFVLFLGQLLITVGVGILGFYFFSKNFYIDPNFRSVFAPELHYYWVQLIVVILGAYFISKTFFTVFEMAVDTVFLCAMKDLSIHDGSPEKPYFMSTKLLKILNKKNLPPQVKDQIQEIPPAPMLAQPSAPSMPDRVQSIYPTIPPDTSFKF